MKNDYSDTNNNISEYIFTDYINGLELQETNDVIKHIPLLLSNGLACEITDSEGLYFNGPCIYRIASKFMIKHNKTLKKKKRRLVDYEYGSGDTVFARDKKELVELTKSVLECGTHFAQLDKRNYCMLNLSFGERESINYRLVFIGKKCLKWKSKFYKIVDKYESLYEQDKIERIYYTDGKPSVTSVFKTFDKMVFKNKDKVLKYIDNWIENIPTYYNYEMIPKLSIMLYGSPGTGKSTFAKAVAKYLGVDSITSVSADYFSDKPDITQNNSRKYTPNKIITIDDIDCVCKSREIKDDMNNAKITQNLLSYLDNPPTFQYKAKDGVRYPISVIIATTNYYDKLDSAVKREGRFDLKIEMKDFDKQDAEEMCSIYDLRLEDIVEDCNKKNFTISPARLQALCLENIDKSIKNK